MKILIAEDDRKLNEGIKLALKSDDLEFIQSFNYRDALNAVKEETPDLMILDVNFPDGSGLDLLRHIRTQKLPIRIIMVTANNTETDIVTGLELGADDYITKPFSLMVLRARVNVQLRREADGSGSRMEIDRYGFDFEKMQFTVSGEPIDLSKTEQRLLKILLENRGRTVSRQRLIDHVWNGEADYVDEHALTVCIKRLRTKLQEDSPEQGYIRTVYGIGYTWVVK